MGQRCTLAADVYSLGLLLAELTTRQRMRRRGQFELPRAPDDCPQARGGGGAHGQGGACEAGGSAQVMRAQPAPRPRASVRFVAPPPPGHAHKTHADLEGGDS